MVGQWDWEATWIARESSPVGDSPFCHATKPPKRDRQAEPEPWRAMIERIDGETVRAYKCARDATRAANPDADDASPAAVGKLL